MTSKINWTVYNKILIPDLPPHTNFEIDNRELLNQMKSKKALMARYVSDWDCKGPTEWWYVIKDQYGDMGDFSSNMRNQIRKGLRNCTVKMIDVDELCLNGYSIYLNAFKRYKSDIVPLSQHEFNKDIRSLEWQKWNFWGVFLKNSTTLIGYAQIYILEDMAEMKVLKFDPDYLNYYPGYALIYTLIEYYLNEKKCKYINNGVRSIYHDTKIQEYLIEKFKFRRAFCKLNLYYRKDVHILIKILYPFRHLINRLNVSFVKKLSSILLQEKIRRSFQ